MARPATKPLLEKKVAVSVSLTLAKVMEAQSLVERWKQEGTDVSLSSFIDAALEAALVNERKIEASGAAHE